MRLRGRITELGDSLGPRRRYEDTRHSPVKEDKKTVYPNFLLRTSEGVNIIDRIIKTWSE